MAVVFMTDHIIQNILAKLPTKSLDRFKCISKHWNRLICDPYLLKLRSRSRRMILFGLLPLHALDDNVPIGDMTNSIVKLCSPSINDNKCRGVVNLIGTFNGIVLMIGKEPEPDIRNFYDTRIVLYNPYTSESKRIRDPYSPFDSNHVYGFGYGATRDDLKIVRFRDHDYYSNWKTCDVYSLKTNSWSMSKNFILNAKLRNEAGTFLNGFLYWIDYKIHMRILALNVNKMELSEMQLPKRGSDKHPWPRLGTMHGRLCTVNGSNYDKFDVWVLEDQGGNNIWSNICSFRVDFEGNCLKKCQPTNILDDGRILMTNTSRQLIIYDTSKHSYKTLNAFKEHCLHLRGIEYVESLVSPSDMCFV